MNAKQQWKSANLHNYNKTEKWPKTEKQRTYEYYDLS